MGGRMDVWLCILISLWTSANAAVYIVDGTSGDDRNDGSSRTNAFQTITKCVKKLANPGDECQVAQGHYHEHVSISGLQGTAGNPIKITGLGDDRPVWDGTVPIEVSWNLNTGICSADIDPSIQPTALFLNDDLLTAARWPNALWSDKSVFNNSFWAHSSKKSGVGVMVDDGIRANLRASGIDATGAMAILNTGSFNTFVGEVLTHNVGSDTFTYDDTFGINKTSNSMHFKPGHNQYYLEASLALLDAPEEWFYDMNNNKLYLVPHPGKGCPVLGKDKVRGRTMDYGLTIRDTDGLTVSNMTFFACNVDASSKKPEKAKKNKKGIVIVKGKPRTYIDNIKLENIRMMYGASSHRMLKSAEKPKWTKLYARVYKGTRTHGNWVNGKVSVINSTFWGSEGLALDYAGGDVYIHNNLFAYNDWTGHLMDSYMGGYGTVNGLTKGEEFSHNTLLYNGIQAGYQASGNRGKPDVGFANIAYNHIVGQCWGKIQNDGAGIQILIGAQREVSVNHNWVRDSPKFAIRFDGQDKNQGSDGSQLYNVVWNTSGLMVKGDNHTVHNNLALMGRYAGKGKPRWGFCNICILEKLFTYPQIMNANTEVLNNAGTLVIFGKNTKTELRSSSHPVSPGVRIENNYSGRDVGENVEDYKNWDFRPRTGRKFTSGPLIGPYDPTVVTTSYWIPGQKLYKTSTPIPPSGNTVSTSRDVVMFLEAYQADSYRWFFGVNKDNVFNAEAKDAEDQGEVEKGRNVLVLPSTLQNNTEYYWRVDAQ